MVTWHKIIFGNCKDMREIPDESIHLMVTSPPYYNAPFDYPDLFKDYDEFEQRYGPYPSEESVSIAIEMVIYYFEGLGTLLRNGLIEINLIHELFNVQGWWEKLWPLISAFRDRLNRSDIYSNFEYLYDAFQKYDTMNQGK